VEWLWTWGGQCFGYRDGDDLWTYDGKHIGRFNGSEVYDRRGRYLGEVMKGDRLITNKAKSGWRSTPSRHWDGVAPMAGTAAMARMACTAAMGLP
jgi:hypothetical protein